MSITDELRQYARHLHNVWYDPLSNVYTYTTMDNAPSLDAVRLDGYVLAIADRIDAEHEKECSKAWMRGHDAWAAVGNEEFMAEHGWVRLPKDADGEYIHIGDMMWQKDHITKRSCKAIMGCEYVMLDGIQGAVYAGWLTHYHAPTVEDVLLEACKAYHGLMVEGMSDFAHDMPAPSEIISEYAAKLRLANDGKEQ